MYTRSPSRFVLSGLLTAALASPLPAQTITVNTGEDAVDFGGAQTVAQLPGPDGLISLREAVTAANNTPGPQTIHFAIPRATWWSLFPNQAGCRLDNPIFLTDNGTTIDFTTQTTLTGDTNPGGWEVAVFYAGATTFVSQFMILANDCTIKGMDYVGGNSTGTSVRIYGSNNRVISSTNSRASVAIDRSAPDGPPSTGNIIGGTAPEDRNDLLRVWFIHGVSGNTIIGNTIRRVQITGDTLYGPCTNNRIGGPTPEERNTISGNGTSGEEGFPTGIQIEISNAVGTIIEGNYIGTTPDGMAPSAIANGTSGISVGLGAVGTIIRNNLISGIARTGTFRYAGQRFGTGIVVTDGSSNTSIIGNRLGLNADGSGTILNVQGLLVARSTTLAAAVTGVTIGGTSPGAGNTITASEQAGLVVHSTVAGVRISGNSIHDNGTLGIDLMGSLGVTPNDVGDTDAGGNNLQNFPIVTSADTVPSGVRVRGTLASTPNQEFLVEFFLSPACDPSGNGEGQSFLGSLQVQTADNGRAAFDHIVVWDVVPGVVVSATATRISTNDTSEFSACRAVMPTRCVADLDDGTDTGTPDGGVTIDDLLYYIGQYAGGTTRADLDDGSGTGTPDGGVTIDDLLYYLQRFEVGC